MMVGCAKQEVQNAQGANQPPELSSTVDKPEETKLDQKTTLAELESKHKLKAYPNASAEASEVYKRGDGGTKFVVTFTTKDAPQKVADFYQAEGLDSKVVDGVATSMGMTKADASVILVAKAGQNGTLVKITAISYDKH